jgi:Protein of unknown function (DUF433)
MEDTPFRPARPVTVAHREWQMIRKIMGGNPVFRGTRVPVHRLAELVPSRASPEGKCWTTPQVLP